MSMPVIVIGGGGHARVLIDALLASSVTVAGIADPDPSLVSTKILGVPVLGGDEIISSFPAGEIRLVNGIGSVGVLERRKLLFEKFKNMGYIFSSVIHPTAVIANTVELGEGVQVMAGAVIQTGSRIGMNSIINTRSSVDHDCIIGDHSHIAPGVTLSGEVTIGKGSHIGTGATLIQGVCIGEMALVGAGSLVLKKVLSGSTVMGVPARMVKR